MPDHQGSGLKKNNNNMRHKVKVESIFIPAELKTLS